MPEYEVTVEVDDIYVTVKAKNEREACKKVRQRWREGKLKPKLRPSRFSGRGSNITAQRTYRDW
jgi:hypothetical protein